MHPYKPSKILYMEVTDYLLWKADDLISSQPHLTQQCSLTSSMTWTCNVHCPVFHSMGGMIDWSIIQVCSIMKKNQPMPCRFKEPLHVNTIFLYCYLLRNHYSIASHSYRSIFGGLDRTVLSLKLALHPTTFAVVCRKFIEAQRFFLVCAISSTVATS